MCKFVFWMFVKQNMDVPEISKLVKACLVHVFYGSKIMLNLFFGDWSMIFSLTRLCGGFTNLLSVILILGKRFIELRTPHSSTLARRKKCLKEIF